MDREALLEKYIQGNLSEKEQEEFDTLLRTDKDFGEEVKFHTNVKKVTEAEDDHKFREMLTDFESEARSENRHTKSSRTKWLIAASVILLLGVGFLFNLNRQTSMDDLYVMNFEPYPNVVHPVERGETQDLKTEAFAAYEGAEYEKSFKLFTQLYAETREAYYLFYQANTLIQMQRAEESLPLLTEFSNADNELVDEANWYLAMAHLQIGDKENAIKALKEVIAQGDYKIKEAEDLLSALE